MVLQDATRGHRECLLDEPKNRSDVYEQLIPSNFYDQPVECPSASAPLLRHGNGQVSRGYGVKGQASCPSLSTQQGKQRLFSSPSGDNNCISERESLINMQLDALDNLQPAGVPDNIDPSDRHISNSESGLRIEKKRKVLQFYNCSLHNFSYLDIIVMLSYL